MASKDTMLYIAVGVSAAFAGFGGNFAHDVINPPRPNPFTSLDAVEMQVDISGEIKASQREIMLELKEMEHRIRSDMPPLATRNRIRNIENFLQEKDNYKVKDYDWQ